MKRYGDRGDDAKGYPALPLNIVLNERLFEKVFKYMMKAFFTEKRLDTSYILELNQELRKNVIKGFERVDFEERKNQETMNEITEELWKKFLPYLRITLRRYNRDFVKKPADRL